MTPDFEDTIAALSTPPGEGGIAVIRISGKEALPLASRFFRPSKSKDLGREPSHTIHHGKWVDEKGEAIDTVLLSLFRAPHSYTGEDVAEVSSHGGVMVPRRILEILYRAGARPAEPGEFTKRAFLRGKIDLTQVESVLDLIRAKSEASLQTAMRQLEGRLSQKIDSLKERLLKIMVHLEAGLDFPDERLAVDSHEECLRQMRAVGEEIRLLLAGFERGARAREGVLTVIVGRPNAGKSSLLNVLLEKERALVSEIPGTTRDALEEEIQIEGRGLRIVDTAGMCLAAQDPLERMGIERTRLYFQAGHLFLFLLDGSTDWGPEDEAIFNEIREKNFLTVINKTDLPQKLDLQSLTAGTNRSAPVLISCLKREGIDRLEKEILEKLKDQKIYQESPTLTRLRHKQAFENCLCSLLGAEEAMKNGFSPEFVLVDLKNSLDSLRELVGEIYSEDLLDVLFREFCIGK